MKKFKLFSILFIIVSVCLCLASCEASVSSFKFNYWNEDAESFKSLIEYVEDVTDKKSENFIPVEDRIAVFDMDGTLCGELFPTYIEYLLCAYRCLEDPTYEATDEMIQVANTIVEGAKTNTFPSDMAMQHAITQAKAFSGLTIEEFDTYVKEFLKQNAAGFENLTYANSFYKPMIEVLAYLQFHDFTTYIVSGSDRFICRACACEVCNIPENQVIGMDVELKSSNQGDANTLDYQFKTGDTVIRTENVLIKNLKMNKVVQISQEIGKQPVLSFGNSSGDKSMHLFTITNNKYRAQAYMLIADDEDRDYGNEAKVASLAADWEANGFIVISMKNDFKTIYGYDIVKTSLDE